MHAETQLSSTFPRTGDVRGLVLLVEFSDVSFQVPNPQAAFFSMLNDSAYAANSATGSARDYFLACSGGVFRPMFDVFGPYRLSRTQEYYGANPKSGHDVRRVDLVKHTCDAALKAGVNFADYDLDNDGNVDNVFIFYAGYSEAEGGPETTIWPHRGVVSSSSSYGGKRIYDYACTSELRGNKGANMCGIGTFCHEFSHVLGLPDLYNTGDNQSEEKNYTVGKWDVMASGSYNNDGRTPPVYSAFERFYLGWIRPEQVKADTTYVLPPLATTNRCLLLAASAHNLEGDDPSPAHYFLLENRQRVGWDAPYTKASMAALPGHGLLISRIAFSASRLASNTFNNYEPLGYDIIEPFDTLPQASSPADLYPGTTATDYFLPRLPSGTELAALRLSQIYEWDDEHLISFAVGNPAQSTGLNVVSDIPLVETDVLNYRIHTYHSVPLHVRGYGLSDTVFAKVADLHFRLSADGGESWLQEQVSLPVRADGSLDTILQVRYEASRQSCDVMTTQLRIWDKNHAVACIRPIQYRSSRPTLIQVPDSFVAQPTSSTSLRVDWKPVEDAESYFLQLYTLDEAGRPHYVYRDTEMEVMGQTFMNLVGLQSGTTYYCQVQASEEKGCERHRSEWSSPVACQTVERPADLADNQLDIRLAYMDYPYVAMVPYSFEDAVLLVFDPAGHQVLSVPVPATSGFVPLPLETLPKGSVYLIKYSQSARLQRKALWAKISL